MEDILKNAFYEEAEELFREIEDCILEMDRTGMVKENVDRLFRYMHTLKGSSAAMQINDMAKLTHNLEDVLGMVREQELDITNEMIDIMLASLDELKVRVNKYKNNESYEIDVEKYITQLDLVKIKLPGHEGKAYVITIHLHEETSMKGVRLFIVTDKLRKSGQIKSTSWDESETHEMEERSFKVIYISPLTKKEIEDLLYTVSDIDKVDVREMEIDEQDVKPKKMKEELQSAIRVNIDKLDKLLRIVEELSVDKERLKQLMKKVELKYSKDIDVKSLCTVVQQIDFIGNEMQESVMSTRMYTLDSVFNRFPRTIRDLSKKQGKEIELKVEGENTELDRSIIEKIIDPLNHIVRNSIDHGIESPDEREKSGKPRKGTIKITAGQEQGRICIKVEDDGKGINLQQVKKKAVVKGLITEEQAESLSEKETLELIFMAGFSTTEKVTDISGRGVGMNVVKENIERINGIIDIDNAVGQGMVITLKLPLTLAIIQSLMIRTKQYRFVLPLLSIIEIFRVKESDYERIVKCIQGKEVVNWRGEILPVMRISNFYETEGEEGNSFVGIVIGLSTRKIVLGVEEIIGQQQVVIKSLERFTGKDSVLGELKGIAGTVILGDGNFAYVLDVQTLLIKNMDKEGGVFYNEKY